MTHRFYKKQTSARNVLISAVVFAAVIFAFWFSVSSVSAKSDEEEIKTLKTAVSRGITYCYTLEGNYPPSLDYLKENYGLSFNEEKYFVDYQPMGTNIMPDVTIIKKQSKKEGSH